jgi:hypothetical protein
MSGPDEGLSFVMSMYTSCTVVIHVAYAELWNLSAVNGIDVIYVAFANCWTFDSRLHCCHTCSLYKLLNRSAVDCIVIIYVAYASCEAVLQYIILLTYMYHMQVVKPFSSRLYCWVF